MYRKQTNKSFKGVFEWICMDREGKLKLSQIIFLKLAGLQIITLESKVLKKLKEGGGGCYFY